MKTSYLKGLNHHAYCIVGGILEHDQLISTLGNEQKIFATANADFIDKTYDSFTIDDARDVKVMSQIKPMVNDAKKIVILSMNGINSEAQNALLKLLEEPADYVHFFIIIPSAHLLLPTVKSRLLFLELGNSGDKTSENFEVMNEARTFLKSDMKKRMEYIKKLTDDISDDKKVKQDAINFLNSIERVVYDELGAKKGRKMLETIDLAKKYANDRSPSIKMLLETVALVK